MVDRGRSRAGSSHRSRAFTSRCAGAVSYRRFRRPRERKPGSNERMKPSPSFRRLAFALFTCVAFLLCFAPAPAHAVDLSVFGASGGNGLAGMDGDPGGPGGNGTDAAAATALAAGALRLAAVSLPQGWRRAVECGVHRFGECECVFRQRRDTPVRAAREYAHARAEIRAHER